MEERVRALTGGKGADLSIDPLGMHGIMLSAVIHTPRVHGHIARIFERMASGELEVVVDRAFPLSEAAAAHRRAEQRGRIGRVVMVA